jgi:DNA-binding transcriptional ArsR family regulator
MSEEDDTYSTIFTALKHPLRRRILRRLQASPATYTELLNELSIENGLLNYHLESVKELLTKMEDGRYTLNEFGKAGVQLLQRVEEPMTESVKGNLGLVRPMHIIGILCIVALAASSLFLYYNNRDLSSQVSFLYNNNRDLSSQVNRQQIEIENAQVFIQIYSSLLHSNFTTPVSKIEAVSNVFSSSNFNSTSLRIKKITSDLYYGRFRNYTDPASTQSVDLLSKVTTPVADYSPRVEYNVTRSGLFQGTVWYRYVWIVNIQYSRIDGGLWEVVFDAKYYVDAATGEIIPIINLY